MKLKFAYILFLSSLFFSVACSRTEGQASGLRTVQAKVFRDTKELASFTLEVAETPQQQAKGLMFRTEMSEKNGMIFVYPREQHNSFWMKNTYISLDMLFLDSKRKIVGILHNVPVLNEEPRSVNAKSKYVVELVAGVSQKKGLKEGDSFTFEPSL